MDQEIPQKSWIEKLRDVSAEEIDLRLTQDGPDGIAEVLAFVHQVELRMVATNKPWLKLKWPGHTRLLEILNQWNIINPKSDVRIVEYDGEVWLFNPKAELLPMQKVAKADKFDRELFILCEEMAELVVDNGYKVSPSSPTSLTWLNSAKRIVGLAAERGGTIEDVRIIMKTAVRDSFWRQNLRSIPNFEKHFDRFWDAHKHQPGRKLSTSGVKRASVLDALEKRGKTVDAR